MEDAPQFAIGLFDIGDCRSCLCSYICCPCSLASARSHMDDSVYIFNILCLPVCCITPVRWMIRSAYDIPGDAYQDCYTSTFCPCCVLNQLLQTSFKRGNTSVSGGYSHNSREFSFFFGTCSNDVATCCYTSLCVPCATGAALQIATGMPYMLGCCCVTPCAARNIIRYQYRLAGEELMDELCAPIGTTVFLTGLFGSPLTALPILSAYSAQIYNEAQYRGRPSQPKYLVSLAGYQRQRAFGAPPVRLSPGVDRLADLDRLESGSDTSDGGCVSDISAITHSSSPRRLGGKEDESEATPLLGESSAEDSPARSGRKARPEEGPSTVVASLASLGVEVGMGIAALAATAISTSSKGAGKGKASGSAEEIGQGYAVAKLATKKHKGKYKAADAVVTKL